MSGMKYYTLGRSGLRVSQLSLGCMTFGTSWGWGCDEKTSRALFDRYVEVGGNFFDTADVYTLGDSERFLGRFVREAGLRSRAVIATKYTQNAEPGNPNSGGNQRKSMMHAVEGSLERLGTDYIDLYFIHAWDMLTRAEEVMRGLDDLVRAGKIRHVGFSDVPAWYAARSQTLAEWRGFEPVATLQLEYSLVERNIEHEFTGLALELGMGIMVWSPLASGLLTGKHKREGLGEGRLAKVKGTSVFDRTSDRNWKIVELLGEASHVLGRSHAQIALNWVTGRPAVNAVILGATKVAQLEDNLQALDFNLPAEWREKLDAISAPAATFPYNFFTKRAQANMRGGALIGDKPDGYYEPVRSVLSKGGLGG